MPTISSRDLGETTPDRWSPDDVARFRTGLNKRLATTHHCIDDPNLVVRSINTGAHGGDEMYLQSHALSNERQSQLLQGQMMRVDPNSFQHPERLHHYAQRGMLVRAGTMKAKSKLRKADRKEQTCG